MTANKLVGMFHNLRLLKRMKEPKYSEPTIAWAEDLEHSAVAKFKPAGSTSASALVTFVTPVQSKAKAGGKAAARG